MKKVFAVLAVLLMLSSFSMAATMSDAELAAVTGQSGVTIDISALQIDLGLGTFTYGDLDGFTNAGSLGNDFTDPGYVNVAFAPLPGYPMHIGIPDLKLQFDVGTSVTTSVTAVNIAGTMNGPITIDAIGVLISLDSVNGATVDYIGNSGSPYPGGGTFDPTYWNAVYNTNKNLGLFCLSNISVLIPTINIQISAH